MKGIFYLKHKTIISFIIFVIITFSVSCNSGEVTTDAILQKNNWKLINTPKEVKSTYLFFLDKNAKDVFWLKDYYSIQLEQNDYYDSTAARIVCFIEKNPDTIDTTTYISSLLQEGDSIQSLSNRNSLYKDAISLEQYNLMKELSKNINKQYKPLLDSIFELEGVRGLKQSTH
jgi:hypothetical protein